MNNKDKIVQTYRELVINYKRADISVVQICSQAQISRKTFYHYFKDRYEVIEEILIQDVEKPLVKALNLHFNSYDVVRIIFEHLLLEKDYYSMVINETSQNSLFDTFVIHFSEIIEKYDVNKKETLTLKEKEYINYRFAVELALMIKKWISEGMKESPEFMSKVFIYPNSIHTKR